MSKTRRNYGYGCSQCNEQWSGYANHDIAWAEAYQHTQKYKHPTDTFFRVDALVTTLYPAVEKGVIVSEAVPCEGPGAVPASSSEGASTSDASSSSDTEVSTSISSDGPMNRPPIVE